MPSAQEVVESGRTTSDGTSPQPAKRRASADSGAATAAPVAKKVAVIETGKGFFCRSITFTTSLARGEASVCCVMIYVRSSEPL